MKTPPGRGEAIIGSEKRLHRRTGCLHNCRSAAPGFTAARLGSILPECGRTSNGEVGTGLRSNSPRMGKGWGVGFVGAAKPPPQTPLSLISRACCSPKGICCTSPGYRELSIRFGRPESSTQGVVRACGSLNFRPVRGSWGLRGGGEAAAPQNPTLLPLPVAAFAARGGKGKDKPCPYRGFGAGGRRPPAPKPRCPP